MSPLARAPAVRTGADESHLTGRWIRLRPSMRGARSAAWPPSATQPPHGA